jgi:hypothetical protein
MRKFPDISGLETSETLPREPTMYGDPLEKAMFAGREVTRRGIYQVVNDPELIVRHEELEAAGLNSEDLLAEADQDVRAVRQLDNEFGIRVPNYIVSLEASTAHYLTGMSRVRGTQFIVEGLSGLQPGDWQLDKIPEPVTIATMEKLLGYYEAVIAGEVTRYIADARPGNLIYGRLAGDYQDDVYLVDIEKQYIFDAAENISSAFETVACYDYVFPEMSRAYDKMYPQLAARALRLLGQRDKTLTQSANCEYGITELELYLEDCQHKQSQGIIKELRAA